jgi:hypothetical protein
MFGYHKKSPFFVRMKTIIPSDHLIGHEKREEDNKSPSLEKHYLYAAYAIYAGTSAPASGGSMCRFQLLKYRLRN